MATLRVEIDEAVRQFALNGARFTIGRLPANDIVIPLPRISRYHAELRAAPDGWWIADLESTNGLRVDGARVRRLQLRQGTAVHLAPGVRILLADGADASDIAARPTTYMPAVADVSQRFTGAAAGDWRPTPLATAWGQASVYGSSAAGAAERLPMVEGDLFRRRRTRVSGAPSGDATRGTDAPVYGAAATSLHICRTCGQQTAPGVAHCQACASSIARPCDACGLSVLPIQDLCPRCQTPNPASVLRARRTPASL